MGWGYSNSNLIYTCSFDHLYHPTLVRGGNISMQQVLDIDRPAHSN